MFQSFDEISPHASIERMTRLRAQFAPLGIDGFLVPRADEYQGEYVPPACERLSWLTGFTGSAGVALITKERGVVFVDGRYTTQAREQVDATLFDGGDLVGEPPHLWLTNHGQKGFRLGIDPWLHSMTEVGKLEAALAMISGQLVFLNENPLDALWMDRPAPPMGPVTIQPLEYCGVPARDKISKIADDLKKSGHQAAILTDPSSVAWVFNIRGADVPHTPHPLSRAIIHADGHAEIFLDAGKTATEVQAYLAEITEQLAPETFADRLEALVKSGGNILIDPELTPFAIQAIIAKAGGKTVEGADPARLPRAIKNPTEIEGMRRAHLQDGVAMVGFLAWLDGCKPDTVSEIDAVIALEQARISVGERMGNPLKDISFDTISGAGSNGAIIHYRVNRLSNRVLKSGEVFLIDSGGQYVNGTTDITRTVAIGQVGQEERRFFTLVLKGMIAITTARFPAKTRGLDIDPLARVALWKAGADYAHGTGHGVGSYLSVHEGPQRIARTATQELLAGMILSNEPGYYRPGQFGIRIENLIVVEAAEVIAGGDLPMLGFATLTLCPIDRRMIIASLLTGDELAWLDAYHMEIRQKLLPLIDDEKVKTWLLEATARL